MSDLDDEELEATRRLNGVAKKSNIERTDINVGNIEKDIKRCEQLIKPEHANWIGISNQLAIAHVVDRVKELEEENTDLKIKNNSRIIGTYAEVKLEEILKEDYIPKQKLKDILQKNRNELFSITYVDPKQYEPYEKQIERINKIETELLEGE